jgi:hypothetical protein
MLSSSPAGAPACQGQPVQDLVANGSAEQVFGPFARAAVPDESEARRNDDRYSGELIT